MRRGVDLFGAEKLAEYPQRREQHCHTAIRPWEKVHLRKELVMELQTKGLSFFSTTRNLALTPMWKIEPSISIE